MVGAFADVVRTFCPDAARLDEYNMDIGGTWSERPDIAWAHQQRDVGDLENAQKVWDQASAPERSQV